MAAWKVGRLENLTAADWAVCLVVWMAPLKVVRRADQWAACWVAWGCLVGELDGWQVGWTVGWADG